MSKINRNQWCVLGLPFDVLDQKTAVKQLIQKIESNDRYFVSTPNLNFVVACQTDANFFKSVVESDLTVADGMPLIWVAKILNIPLPERIAGSSMFEELAKSSVSEKVKVFFFGGQPGIAEKAYQKLNQQNSSITACGYYDPGFVSVDQMSTPEIINEINRTKPDFVLVALGAKKGQEWIQKNKNQISPCVISHLGAVINFVAGNVERAPVVWQKTGFEWLWRIKQEPTLWKRYLKDGLVFFRLITLNVIPLAILQRLFKNSKENYSKVHYKNTENEQTPIEIELGGSLSHESLGEVDDCLDLILDNSLANNLSVNFKNVNYIDGAFIAHLLSFQSALERRGCQLTLTELSLKVKMLFRLNNVLTRFMIL